MSNDNRTCGHYASEAHRKNGARIGDNGCPLEKGHKGTHRLSDEALRQVEEFTR